MTSTPGRAGPQARRVEPHDPNATTVEGWISQADLVGRLIVEYADTADMDDGQPLPPLIIDGAVWCVVRRLPGARTHWRRLSLGNPHGQWPQVQRGTSPKRQKTGQ